MAIPHPSTQPVLRAQLATQGASQLAGYWQVKVTAAITRLETEMRRMLQLEQQLGLFAERYLAQVGAAAERLSGLCAQLGETAMRLPLPEVTLVQSYSARSAARQTELKTRYRSLAKELHPDRACAVAATGDMAEQMHQLNAAYRREDLAALLKIEARLYLMRAAGAGFTAIPALEAGLRDIARAADTYAQGYRELLNSPLNDWMLRALSAQREGWDWMDTTLRSIARMTAEKEQLLGTLMAASGIGQTREDARQPA